jgi:hypothetical protein
MLQPRNQRLFILLLILLLAAFIRFWGITSQSFWIDEGFTWNLTQYHDVFSILKNDVHPPLYFLMIDKWVDFTGTSELAMRYFSLLPSLLSVAVVYQLAHEIIINRSKYVTTQGVRVLSPVQQQSGVQVPLFEHRGFRGWDESLQKYSYLIPVLAALLMAIAEVETNLSQEARSYTWHVLWACLSMWGFLRSGRTSQRFWLLLWISSIIALIYTFYLGAFVGVAQGVYALIFWRGKKRLIAIGALGFCAISLLPWLLLTGSEQSQNISHGEVILPKDYPFWLNDFRHGYFTGQWALMIGLFVLGLVYFERDRIQLHPTAILLLLWFAVPLLLTLIMNSFVPTYQPRRVSQIVPAIALLTAFGLGHIRGKVLFFLVGVIAIYGIFSVDFWRFKQLWREMATETAPLIAQGTPLFFELAGDDYAPRYHYGSIMPHSHDFLLDEGEADPDDNVLIGLTTWQHLQPESYEAGLPAIINSLEHLWLFYWSSDEGALFWLEQFGFTRTASISRDYITEGVFLYRYDRLPETAIQRYEHGLVLRDALIHEDLYVELLWSTESILETDYTFSVALLDESGQLVAQLDSQATVLDKQYPSSSWQVGEVIYDPKNLEVSHELVAGTYQLILVVYQIENEEIIRLNTVQANHQILLDTIEVKR